MDLGMVGLGRMGGNMALRLMRGGHHVVAFDLDPKAVEDLRRHGATGARGISDMVALLSQPRVVWLMLPQGAPTQSTLDSLLKLLSHGDIIIEGANSYYKDTMARAPAVEKQGVDFVDVGTSGGIWGLEGGYSLMVGGKESVFRKLEPIFKTLAPAPDKGYGYMGPHGAGHFTKMVHNAIEYALMEAYAEGFQLLAAKKEFNLDLAQISDVWSHGSVVKSWLLEKVSIALHDSVPLDQVKGYVEDTGEGRWTVKEAVDLAVSAPGLTLALYERFRSRDPDSLNHKLQARLRNIFGGHAVKKSGE